MTALTLVNALNNAHIDLNQKKYNLPDVGKMAKPSSRSVQVIHEPSSQKDNKRSSCHWFVNAIKRIFEKFLCILRCIFCCKYPPKKKEVSQEKTLQKVSTSLSSTTITKPRASVSLPNVQKQTEPATSSIKQPSVIQADPLALEEMLEVFKKLPKDLKLLCGEYLDANERLNISEVDKDTAEKVYQDLLKEIAMEEKLSTRKFPALVKELKMLSEILGLKENIDYEFILKHCKNLKNLYIDRPFDEELLKRIAINLPSSAIVSFEHTDLTDKELEIFAKNCPQLNGINLFLTNITDDGLRALGTHCKQLKSFHINGHKSVSNIGLQELFSNCKKLKDLNLWGIREFNDQLLHALVTNCKQLERLSIPDFRNIDDEGLQKLTKNCNKLKFLNLWGCKQITDKGLQAIAKNCKEPLELSLVDCPLITDAGLKVLAENCKLRSLHLSWGKQITDKELHVLAKQMHLKELSLCGCMQITDIGLRTIAACCEQLEYLNLGYTWITDEALKSLANCKQLKKLSLSGCNELTEAGVKELQALFPDLKIVWKN